MKIVKDDLKTALEIVKPGLANRDLIEQSTSFAFVNGKVVTYNDEISISHPVEFLNLTGAISAENLYKFLGKVSQKEIDLEINDAEVVLSAGRAKANFTLQSEIKLPLEEQLGEKGKWAKLPEGFIDACRFVMTSSGTNMSQPLLTCVHINKDGFVEASDGYRITRYTLSTELSIPTLLIPAASVVEMVKLAPTRIALGQGWAHFRCQGGTIISCRLFAEDKYPTMDQHLQVSGTRVILPEGLDETLARAMVFSKRERMLEEEIHITVDEEGLTMEATSDTGRFIETLEMEKHDDKKISFVITPYLLKDILKETRACEVTNNRIKFAGSNWVYVGILKALKNKK